MMRCLFENLATVTACFFDPVQGSVSVPKDVLLRMLPVRKRYAYAQRDGRQVIFWILQQVVDSLDFIQD